jgi:hypothetical protein
MGMTSALFHIVETVDCRIEAFKIDATGKASTIALDLSTQLGISSGPGDFDVEMEDSLWYLDFTHKKF